MLTAYYIYVCVWAILQLLRFVSRTRTRWSTRRITTAWKFWILEISGIFIVEEVDSYLCFAAEAHRIYSLLLLLRAGSTLGFQLLNLILLSTSEL